MAACVSATGPPSPIFSPAAVQITPAAVSRSPIAASPGHWWDSPQPSAIFRLCAPELVSRPVVTVRAGRPALARAWLIVARTCAAAVPPVSPLPLAAAVALAEPAVGDGEAADVPAAGVADAARVGRDVADGLAWPGWLGGTVTRTGGPARATSATDPARAVVGRAPIAWADAVAGGGRAGGRKKATPAPRASAPAPSTRNRRLRAAVFPVPRSMSSPPNRR